MNSTNSKASGVASSPTAMESGVCFRVSESLVARILRKAAFGDSERLILAGKLRTDTEYIVIMIPLWFNVIRTFLLFTDQRIIFARKTLWRGLAQVVEISYSDVYSIDLQESKGSFWEPSKVFLRLKNGKMIEFRTANYQFVQAIGEKVASRLSLSTVA